MNTFRRITAAAAVTSALFGASAAKANTAVQYFTANPVFSAGVGYNSTFASNTALGADSVTYTTGSGNQLQLSFTPFTSPILSLADNIANPGNSLGTFTLTETGLNGSDSASVTNLSLKFDLYQNIPTSVTNPIGNYVGTVTVTGLTVINSVIGTATSTLTFNSGNSIDSNTTPDILYILTPTSYNVSLLLQNGGPTSGSTPITASIFSNGVGDPNGAPLPAVASTGLTMLGLLACGLAGRKLARRVSVA